MKKPKIDFKNIRVRKPGKKSILIGLVIIILVVVGIFAATKFKDYRSTENKNDRVSKKFDDLNKENVNCDQINSELGNQPLDDLNLDTQRKVLEQRLPCLSDANDNDKALQTAQKLRAIYQKQGDDYAIKSIDMTISGIKAEKQQ